MFWVFISFEFYSHMFILTSHFLSLSFPPAIFCVDLFQLVISHQFILIISFPQSYGACRNVQNKSLLLKKMPNDPKWLFCLFLTVCNKVCRCWYHVVSVFCQQTVASLLEKSLRLVWVLQYVPWILLFSFLDLLQPVLSVLLPALCCLPLIFFGPQLLITKARLLFFHLLALVFCIWVLFSSKHNTSAYSTAKSVSPTWCKQLCW